MSILWSKAIVAAASAKGLLRAGDTDGAVNRSYYAMFYACRASLRFINPDLDTNKTHAGLIRRFSRELVVQKGLDSRLGRLFAEAEALRYEADYSDAATSTATAAKVVADMDVLLSAISGFIGKDLP